MDFGSSPRVPRSRPGVPFLKGKEGERDIFKDFPIFEVTDHPRQPLLGLIQGARQSHPVFPLTFPTTALPDLSFPRVGNQEMSKSCGSASHLFS